MADVTQEHDYRVLPPSGKGKVYRATMRFLEAAGPAAKLGATIGGLAMAAALMTFAAPLLGPGMIGATATAAIYTGIAAIAGGLFTAGIFGGINALRSYTEDTLNDRERAAIIKEQPVPLVPVIDPELSAPAPLRSSPSFEQRLQAEQMLGSGAQRQR